MTQRQFASVLFAAVGVIIAVIRLPELFAMASIIASWDRAVEGTPGIYPSAAWTLVGLTVVAVSGVGFVFF